MSVRKAFISYAHADAELASRLIKDIAYLKTQGIIDVWSDKALQPGDYAVREISAKIDEADIILLFVSPDFLASWYCYEVELRRAMERHARNEARVIPVLLRSAPWELSPFGQLQAIPAKGEPPLSNAKDKDAAYTDVVLKLAEVAKLLPGDRPATAALQPAGDPDDFPAVSVCTITKRMNAGLERMLELLKVQDFHSFEWVIVDGHYHVRRDRVEEMIGRQQPKFPITYVPPKPSPWTQVRPALSNALNTALIWARGRTIVELDDCCKTMPTDWLQKHATSNLKGFALTGSYATGKSADGRRDSFSEPTRIGPEHFYSAHRSYPLAKAIEVNGYEEMLDGEQGQSDITMAFMLAEAGVKFFYDPGLVIDFDETIHSLTQFSPDPSKRKWPREPWIAEPKTKIMDDGSPHYANEWLAHRIKQERWTRPNGNPFLLATLRDIPPNYDYKIEAVQKELASFQTAAVDWRDGQPVSEVPGGDFLVARNPDVVITPHPVKSAVISRSGSHVAVAKRGTITRLFPKARRSETVEGEFDWKAIGLAPHSNRIIACARFARVYAKDLESVQDFPTSADEIHAVAMSPNERLLATGGWDCQVHVWNAPEGDRHAFTPKLSGSITAIAFLDEARLLAATSAGTVETIDVSTGAVSCSDPGFSDPITALAGFVRDGRAWYVVGSEDGDLRVMSAGECTELAHLHNSQVIALHVSDCGTYCVSGDRKGTALLWYLPGRLLIQKVELTQPVLAAHLEMTAERLLLVTAKGDLLSWTMNPRIRQGLFVSNLDAIVSEKAAKHRLR